MELQKEFSQCKAGAYIAPHMKVGQRIRELREARGLTQPELANRCGWGYTQARVSHYETGRRMPSLDDLDLLAAALQCDITDFLDVSRKPARNDRKVPSPQVIRMAEMIDELPKQEQQAILRILRGLHPGGEPAP